MIGFMLPANKKVKWGTLGKVDVLISMQLIGLFRKILQLMSFRWVELVSQKDAWKPCTLYPHSRSKRI